MPLYRPSKLKEFLDSLNIQPKKRLSQNFLIDGNIVRKIISEAEIQSNDVIVEIGSGPGALSEAILEKGAKLIAIEKDSILADALNRFQTEKNILEVICRDIQTIDIDEFMHSRLSENTKAKVVANLPYHLTTPIIEKLVPLNKYFSTLILMVQEEVARRFAAKPGTSEYGSFTVFLNFFSSPTYAFPVNRNCFYPSPNVDSAVVALTLKEPPKVNQENFFRLTRTAFSQRRKMLRSSLRNFYSQTTISEALLKCKLDPLSRPQDLSLEQWLSLFSTLKEFEV